MITPGHIAASYLISGFPIRPKEKLRSIETLFIVFSGNSFDLDFFLPPLFGYPGGLHHYLPTHTPIFGIVLFSILYFLFRKKFSTKTFILAGVAMASHLVLDDFNHLLGWLNLDSGITSTPQILWEYPFNLGRKKTLHEALEFYKNNPTSNAEILSIYTKSKLFVAEIITVVVALLVFTKDRISYTGKTKEKK
ncbi:MAG: hypothetical protein WC841_05455 [Candidatus Shapirobacteria bacterium]|jgi:hypothetical protein